MDKQKKLNIINTYYINSKFKNLLSTQPIDNLYIQSSPFTMKIKKEINILIPSTKKKIVNNQNIYIDKNFNFNYKNENEIKINKYINFLIKQGIIKQDKSSNNYYIINESEKNKNIDFNLEINNNISSNVNKKINFNEYNVIEKVNSIEIFKKKRFIIPQIMVQLYIENESKYKGRGFSLKKMEKINKEINFEIIHIPNLKKYYQGQLIDSLSLKNISNLDKNNLEININNSISKNPYISPENNPKNNFVGNSDEINMTHILKQNINNYITFPKEKLSYNNSNNIFFFIKPKLKEENKIQKIEQIIIFRKKRTFYIKDNIINLLIYPDENEYEDEENNIYLDNNSNNEINNINGEYNEKIILRNKKNIKRKNINKNKIPLIIEQKESLFIDCAYDMLVVEKTWDNLYMENNINNFFINGINNIIFGHSNINRDININNLNSPRNLNIGNDIKSNKSIEILLDNNEEKNKNWNKVILPKFVTFVKILGNKLKITTKNKYDNKIKNIIINEIWLKIIINII